MTTIKYSKAVLKYEDEDVFVEIDVRVLPTNKDCDVSVVYTWDEWRTSRSKNGSFQKNLSPDESLYRISIFVAHIPRNSRIWFALKLVDHKYHIDDQGIWDNNDGMNYEIIPEKLPQICLPSKEADLSRSRPQSPPQHAPQSSLHVPNSFESPPQKTRKSSPPLSRSPSPPQQKSSPLQSPQHSPPHSPQHSPPLLRTQFSSQHVSRPQISPHAQPFVSQRSHVQPQQYQPPTIYQPFPARYQPSPVVYQQSPQYQQPPTFFQQSPIFTLQHPPTTRPTCQPQPQLSSQPITSPANPPPNKSSSPPPTTPAKTLTPQQLFQLQHKLQRLEAHKLPPIQKPTPSHVFIPSDIFTNHSICSMMQGHHRIYDEYIC